MIPSEKVAQGGIPPHVYHRLPFTLPLKPAVLPTIPGLFVTFKYLYLAEETYMSWPRSGWAPMAHASVSSPSSVDGMQHAILGTSINHICCTIEVRLSSTISSGLADEVVRKQE